MRIRTLILSTLWVLISAYASAQVKWVGAGDGISWSDAANWSSNAVPVAADDVLLDNTTILTDYDVNLPAGAVTVTVNSITIVPAAGNTIRLILPVTNTAIDGLNIVTAGDALVLNTGGHFINASAANVNIDGNLVVNSGSSLDVSQGANSPVLAIKGNILINAGATGPITESGTGNPVIKLNGNSSQTITSVAGAITGDNLDFVVSTTGTVSLLSSVFLPHDLFVQTGILDISNSAISYTLGVKGDLTVNGTITESGTSPLARLTLNGTINQNITVSSGGSITGDELDFRLNNPAGATLLSDLVLPYSYTISGGNLTIADFSITVQFINITAAKETNHIITNGTGFVIIPNIGLQTRTFYVGIDAFSINEVAIQNGSGLTYSVRVDPGVNPPITTPFAAVDRTWTINTNSPAANPVPANVTFYYYTGQGRSQFDYSSTVDIGQFITNAWNIVQNGLLPATNPPEYRAYGPINSFNTPFIVGNHGAILPIDFSIVCKAEKKDNNATINWDVDTDDNVSQYEIERAVNGGNFNSMASITPGGNKSSYKYNDKNLPGGTSLYRIKVVMNDGRVRYSNTVAILFNTKSFLITAVAPNPMHGDTKITISSPVNTSVRMMLYDAQGKMVKQWQQALSDGTNVIPLQAGNLLPGIYLLTASDGNIRTNTIRVIKQ